MPGTADTPASINNGFFGHLSFQKTPSDLATPTLLKRRSKGRPSGVGASTTPSASRRKSTPLAHAGASHDRTPIRARAAAQSQADEDAGWFRLPPAQRDPPANATATRQPPLHAEEQERSEEQVARSALLAEFGELCAHFPIELYRSLRFIRSCDDAAMGHARALDRSCRQLQASRNLADSLGLRQEIARHMQRARADRAEACAEAAKLQQLVEVHRLMLKAEKQKIEKPAESLAATDLKSAAEQARLAEATATAVASTAADTPNTAVVEDKKMDSKRHKHKGKRKSLLIKSPKRTRDKTPATPVADMDEDEDMNHADEVAAAGEQEVIFDIPIDEDEPVYCYCNRVSFGKMLACENEACEGGEWFHFPCLGITSAPKGKWFCETCLKQAGRQGRGRPETAQERRTRLKRERREQEVKRRARQSGRR